MHGLQVAYGTLLASFLREEPIDHLVDFFRSVELPMTHSELGLTDDQMVEVIMKAPETRSERYTILEKLNMNEKQTRKKLQQYNEHLTSIRGS